MRGVKARGARLGLPALPALPGRGRPPAKSLLMLTQSLSVLLGAGLPLDRSLATLQELADHPELKRIVSEVLHAVQGGKSLAEALAQHPYFPPLYVNMVRAGEIGGFLDQALQRLAEYLERGQQLRDDVRAALTYPALLTVAMGGSMLVLLIYVLPKFSALFADMGKALPLSARIVMGVSDALRNYWWVGLLVIVSRRRRVPLFRPHAARPLRVGRSGSCASSASAPCSGGWRWRAWRGRSGRCSRAASRCCRRSASPSEIAGNQVIARAIGEVEVGAREGAGVAEPLARSGRLPARSRSR